MTSKRATALGSVLFWFLRSKKEDQTAKGRSKHDDESNTDGTSVSESE